MEISRVNIYLFLIQTGVSDLFLLANLKPLAQEAESQVCTKPITY